MNKDRNSVQFKQERTYTLRPPKFKLFQNVKYLLILQGTVRLT